jgi:hypothetical protein
LEVQGTGPEKCSRLPSIAGHSSIVSDYAKARGNGTRSRWMIAGDYDQDDAGGLA